MPTHAIAVSADSITYSPFKLPGATDGLLAAFPQPDPERAPFIALLKIPPGGSLPRHLHHVAREAIYVVAGELINAGQRLPAGSFIAHGPGVEHGPHATETGCTLMFIQSTPVTDEDVVLT
jgi:anti-sigma factor ChrR (cupin superfamily)